MQHRQADGSGRAHAGEIFEEDLKERRRQQQQGQQRGAAGRAGAVAGASTGQQCGRTSSMYPPRPRCVLKCAPPGQKAPFSTQPLGLPLCAQPLCLQASTSEACVLYRMLLHAQELSQHEYQYQCGLEQQMQHSSSNKHYLVIPVGDIAHAAGHLATKREAVARAHL